MAYFKNIIWKPFCFGLAFGIGTLKYKR